MSTCNSSAGTMIQLVSVGALTKKLCGEDADVHTLFKHRAKKSTCFAADWTSMPISGMAFDANVQITVQRNADLLGEMFLVADLPGLTACEEGGQCGTLGSSFPTGCAACSNEDLLAMLNSLGALSQDVCGLKQKLECGEPLSQSETAAVKHAYNNRYGGVGECEVMDECPCAEEFNGGNYAYWCNATGYALIEQVQIVVGGNVIDTHIREFMFVYEELSGFAGKRVVEMVNRHQSLSSLICASANANGIRMYVPLHFWFCRTTTNYLSLASLQFHQVQIRMKFAPLRDLIIVSKPGLTVKAIKQGPNIELRGHLLAKTVYLGSKERELASQHHFEQMIVQLQYSKTMSKGPQLHQQLYFNLALKYMQFVVRRSCHTKNNNWFNFSGWNGLDPVSHLQLKVNNSCRFSDTGSFFRLVENYMNANNIPMSFIYSYHFAVHPYDHSGNHSGSANASRFDSMVMDMTVQEELSGESLDVFVFAENINLMKFQEGLAGPVFAS